MRAINAATGPAGADESAICAQVLAGNTSAFASLMQRHNRSLYRAVRSILRDDQEAEDALQEAWLDVFRGLSGFRGQSSMSTWLTRIAVNAALARRRKQLRRAEVVGLWADQDGWTADDLEPPGSTDDSQSPDQLAEQSEMRTVLERCIDRLPDQFRTVFVLRALEEMPSEDVATVLDIPEATARSRFFRARAMLREALARELDGAETQAFGFDGERCARITASVMRSLQQMQQQADGQHPFS